MLKKHYRVIVQTIISTNNIQECDDFSEDYSDNSRKVTFNRYISVFNYWYEPLTFYKSTIRTLNKLLCNKKAR
jgi:hypothetical protein